MNASEYQRLTSQLTRSSFLVVMAWINPAALVAGFIVGVSLGLGPEDAIWAVTRFLPPVLLTGGIILPWLLIRLFIRRALAEVPGEDPGERYVRLLKLPWKLALVGVFLPYLYGGVTFTVPVAIVFSKSPMLVGLGLLVGVAFGVLISIPVSIRLEQMFMTFALEERPRLRERVSGSGFFWPRLSWYLPYVFSTALTATLALTGLVIALKSMELRASQTQAILADTSIPKEQAEFVASKLTHYNDALLSSVGLPLAVLGLFMLLLPALSAWMLARRQAKGAGAVLEALEGLASGKPAVPDWCSTDEIGDLSSGMVAVLARLQEIPTTLRSSAGRLSQAGAALGSASGQQRESLMQQSAALQEAQVTSQEIRQTSELAATKAETVLGVAARAEQLGQSGETAIDKTLNGLNSIRQFVDGMRTRVLHVQQSASQIHDIASSVKDLADQSNILAINASIEAARSGEQGRGFAVVAREFRSLADQSIRETVRIGRILDQVGEAIRELASMTDQGAKQVEGGLEMVRSSGDSLRELSVIIRENAAAARQIAAAVSQQNTGVTQIFTAIAQLNMGMEETVQRLDTTLEATRTLEAVTQEVSSVAQRYQMAG
ncbi:methyl-accepting chemotaxis protein [Myxococcaceae bacterium GXIMD 01537]